MIKVVLIGAALPLLILVGLLVSLGGESAAYKHCKERRDVHPFGDCDYSALSPEEMLDQSDWLNAKISKDLAGGR